MSILDSSVTSQDDALAGIESSPQTFGLSVMVDSPQVRFSIKSRNRQKKKAATGGGGGGIISLPVPANLSTGYGMAYDTGTGLGVVGKAAYDALREGGNIQSVVDSFSTEGAVDLIKQQALAVGASLSQDVATAIGAGLAKGIAGAGIGAAVGNALGGGVTGAIAGAGLAVNPHLAVLFTGPRFRVHSFNYKLSPTSAGESNKLRDILKQFKLAMAPSIQGDAFFNYPDEFDISFPENEKYTFKIGTSVLTDMSVNYTPDGGSYFHDNGAPVSVAFSLSFTELDVITKAKINEGR